MDRIEPKRLLPRVATIAAAALLAACAAPTPSAHDAHALVEARIAQRCAAQTALSLGAEVATIDDFRPEDRMRATRLLGIDRSLQVVAIHAGSPADAAGLQPGDIVETVNGVRVPAGPPARQAFLAAADAGADAPMLQVRRDGQLHRVTLPVRAPCTISVEKPSRPSRS